VVGGGIRGLWSTPYGGGSSTTSIPIAPFMPGTSEPKSGNMKVEQRTGSGYWGDGVSN
jgi:hypothetical protein